MNEETKMNPRKTNVLARKALVSLSIVGLSCALHARCSPLHAYSRRRNKPESSPQNQETFALRKRLADALIKAAATFDVAALTKILGPGGEDLVASEDTVETRTSPSHLPRRRNGKLQ